MVVRRRRRVRPWLELWTERGGFSATEGHEKAETATQKHLWAEREDYGGVMATDINSTTPQRQNNRTTQRFLFV